MLALSSSQFDSKRSSSRPSGRSAFADRRWTSDRPIRSLNPSFEMVRLPPPREDLRTRSGRTFPTRCAYPDAACPTFYVASDALLNSHRNSINSLTLDARHPTMQGSREIVEAGGPMSYAPNYLFRHTADYVDKILRGTKSDEIPVEQPTKFDLVINLKTAKALGLNVPLHLQHLADDLRAP